MKQINIQRTLFSVSDFLSWKRNGNLTLSPKFQRRPVWKKDAKSYFIDTVVRNLPAPIIYVRKNINIDDMVPDREIVDGQQRLRTLFSYIEPSVLDDYDEEKDDWQVKSTHNKRLAGKQFNELSDKTKQQILNYEFSTHILPAEIEDQEVLKIFARLNSTGTKLNSQEIRNSQYYGEFKTLSYDLAYEQLERWRKWKVFYDSQISRMKEVEMTSDLLANMLEGLRAKTKTSLDDIYQKYDDKIKKKDELASRFRKVMNAIDNIFGDEIRQTKFTNMTLFFLLFVYFYDVMYGLGSDLEHKKPNKISPKVKDGLLAIDEDYKNEELDEEIHSALRSATTDVSQRKKGLEYIKKTCNE